MQPETEWLFHSPVEPPFLIWTWAWNRILLIFPGTKTKIACKGSSSANWAWLSSSNYSYHCSRRNLPGPHICWRAKIHYGRSGPSASGALTDRTDGVPWPWVLRQNGFWFAILTVTKRLAVSCQAKARAMWPCVESVRWSNRVRQSKCPVLSDGSTVVVEYIYF